MMKKEKDYNQEMLDYIETQNRWTAAQAYCDKEVAAYVARRKHDHRTKEEKEAEERSIKKKGKVIMALFLAGVVLLLIDAWSQIA